ncbi:hypothetical protein N7468_006307 [Penicillium chermesinum]|uniref:Uncharacterized protein n=1 Tax=Penicillium chermesinum TaxID=63820 RepID=A0A9W9NS04_9EURO|nr:uncharacterized protein N7468_006307 [Penicillium chermesinum]KAJ5225082.1 hypothetical protein N7468_006307 [Penicillium chermesinum]
MDAIRKLVAQYFQLVDPPNLALPPGHVLVRPETQTALYERMFDESLTPLPPTNYRARVLKVILAQIEASIQNPDEDEILDDLMTCWANLIAQPKPSSLTSAQQLSHIKYTTPINPSDAALERTVITSESRGLILAGGTTGFRTWEAALHLGSFLSSPSGEELVRGKRVIELGAGTGFLSLLCARHLGVRGVIASDREITLIENMNRSAPLNRVADSEKPMPFHAALWEWGTPLEWTDDMQDFVENDHISFDIALGADLIYDTDIVPLLLSTVRDLFENYRVQHFIIAATIRNEDTFKTFLSGCGKQYIVTRFSLKGQEEVLTATDTHQFAVERIAFESTPSDQQTGFFHATNIPI